MPRRCFSRLTTATLSSCGSQGRQFAQHMTQPLELRFRVAVSTDLAALEAIRAAAFAPVFESFRQLLGDEIYALAQAREDRQQGALLASLLQPDSGWAVHVALRSDQIAGFVSFRLNTETLIGEIGLNAVHPDLTGQGIGTAMYDFAVVRMHEAGMKVATVATGADASHAPARRAYEKAGFLAQVPSVWMCRKL